MQEEWGRGRGRGKGRQSWGRTPLRTLLPSLGPLDTTPCPPPPTLSRHPQDRATTMLPVPGLWAGAAEAPGAVWEGREEAQDTLEEAGPTGRPGPQQPPGPQLPPAIWFPRSLRGREKPSDPTVTN